eukprot:14034397-Alexandrium_andersonii.AAC.1
MASRTARLSSSSGRSPFRSAKCLRRMRMPSTASTSEPSTLNFCCKSIGNVSMTRPARCSGGMA